MLALVCIESQKLKANEQTEFQVPLYGNTIPVLSAIFNGFHWV